eukprot:TRINITY_DN703_c0_g3_i4.p1 TRINITY_DN703_c0_g3~~TRINITY_DN703_c0_g3_i4.p1  ORF type:complete len:179 (+),score=61.67 TRINITY_DN703_c0_g3_i4:78-614(+)
MLRAFTRLGCPSLLQGLSFFRAVSDYDEKAMEKLAKPQNVGKLDAKSPDVGTGLVGSPACGDVFKVQIKVNDKGVIEKAVFKTFGCVGAIASSSYATEMLHGKKLEDAVKIKNQDISAHLKLPPVKMHCSLLAEQAIKAAIKDYKKKQEKAGKGDADLKEETERVKKNLEEKAEEIKL